MKAIVHDRYGPPDDVLVLKESAGSCVHSQRKTRTARRPDTDGPCNRDQEVGEAGGCSEPGVFQGLHRRSKGRVIAHRSQPIGHGRPRDPESGKEQHRAAPVMGGSLAVRDVERLCVDEGRHVRLGHLLERSEAGSFVYLRMGED